MTIDALPALDRTSATFKTDLDALFLTALPAFSVQAEAARVAINASTVTAEAARVTAQAAIDAGLANAATNAATATTKAATATTKAAEAAASAASIAGGPVASVNGRTGSVTGVQDALVSGTTIKTINNMSLLGAGDVVLGSVGNHAVSVTNGNGHGSTNTAIRRFTTTKSSVGTHIVYADSATLGASFTIATGGDGLYEIAYGDSINTGTCAYGASVNSTQLTTAIGIVNINSADRLFANYMPASAAGFGPLATITARLAAGSVVRPHTHGQPNDASTYGSTLSIRKVGL